MALLVLLTMEPENPIPYFTYTAEDLALISKYFSHQFNKNKRLWYTSREKKILPQRQAEAMIKWMHQWAHLRVGKLIQTFSKTKYHVPGLKHLVEQVVHKCVPCKKSISTALRCIQGRGTWETDLAPTWR